MNPAFLALGTLGLLVGASKARSGSRAKASFRWKKTSLEKGETLYHGTQSPSFFNTPTPPAWFTQDRWNAEFFVDWQPPLDDGEPYPRIQEYVVRRRIPDLALLETPEDVRNFLRKLFGHARYFHPYRARTARYGEGIVWDYAEDLEDQGYAYEMAQACCEAGFRGWRIPNNYALGADDILLCAGYEDDLELVRRYPVEKT